MSMLGTGQLEAMRDSQDSLLLSEAVWATRGGRIADGKGGHSYAHEAQPGVLPCRVGPPTSAERTNFADRFKGWPGWVLTTSHDTTVAVGDWLAVGTTTYEVVGDLTEGESILTARRLAVVHA